MHFAEQVRLRQVLGASGGAAVTLAVRGSPHPAACPAGYFAARGLDAKHGPRPTNAEKPKGKKGR